MNDDPRVKRIKKYEQIICDVERMIENYIEDKTHILQEKVKELVWETVLGTGYHAGGSEGNASTRF